MKEKKEKKERVHKKLSSKAKKIIILSAFCLLLLVTGGVNIYLNNIASNQASANVQTSANFFSNYRTDRKETRNQEILYLDAIIASETTSAEAKANAEAERLKLISNMDSIMKILSKQRDLAKLLFQQHQIQLMWLLKPMVWLMQRWLKLLM